MLLLFITVVAPPVRGERRLIKRAKDGDVAAFEELLAANGPAMRRLAYSMLGSEAAMDDVLQTAYVRAFRALPKFDGRSSFGTWLHRIVANAAVDELRRIARRGEVDLEALEGRPRPRPAPTSRAPATPAWTSRTRSPACPPTCGSWC